MKTHESRLEENNAEVLSPHTMSELELLIVVERWKLGRRHNAPAS